MSARLQLACVIAFSVGAGLGCRPTPRAGDAVTVDAGPVCAKRTGGAEITIQVNDQTFKFVSAA